MIKYAKKYEQKFSEKKIKGGSISMHNEQGYTQFPNLNLNYSIIKPLTCLKICEQHVRLDNGLRKH